MPIAGRSRSSIALQDINYCQRSRNAAYVRQFPAAVGAERHRAIKRIRPTVFSECAAVSRSRAREWNFHRLTWLYGHVRQRLVVTTRGPAPELDRRLAHSYDLSRRRRWDRAFEDRGARRRAGAQLIGLLVRVSNERELRIPQRPDLLRQAVNGLWIGHVAQTAITVRRWRGIQVVAPTERLAIRIG